MSGYDPACGVPYGEWLKRKGIGFNPNGVVRTERVTAEGYLPSGERFKTVQDELGNRVRERSAEMGVSTGQDVHIAAPCVTATLGTTETRDVQPATG
ncbi:hypothetical protein IMZ11_02290 [Microtetraspora sp. AC03309]|uniref:hypothetical protein n=1 Tax=Microtetraspora sp. AC03309 TaxID=2779376 RepID=UPI001E5BB2E2|nr:hypothetical protein [Microtetraspora sp. AC03309]MCC5574470.1 hypothetical protein [Microtetraspora sp. AC03309]